jgi:hypothetical protein
MLLARGDADDVDRLIGIVRDTDEKRLLAPAADLDRHQQLGLRRHLVAVVQGLQIVELLGGERHIGHANADVVHLLGFELRLDRTVGERCDREQPDAHHSEGHGDDREDGASSASGEVLPRLLQQCRHVETP